MTEAGTLEKKYINLFGDTKNSLESAYSMPKAQNAIEENIAVEMEKH